MRDLFLVMLGVACFHNTLTLARLAKRLDRRIDSVHHRIDNVRREAGLPLYPPGETPGGYGRDDGSGG